jgi:hypothetical protein
LFVVFLLLSDIKKFKFFHRCLLFYLFLIANKFIFENAVEMAVVLTRLAAALRSVLVGKPTIELFLRKPSLVDVGVYLQCMLRYILRKIVFLFFFGFSSFM